jgi:hypothetical protein
LDQTGADVEALRIAVDRHVNGLPVLAVVGAFNSGKSSLIKRLCIDEGVSVPEGLVISAEPSTQGADEVQVGWWLLRDTPGLDSEHAEHAGVALSAAIAAERTLLLLLPNLFSDDSETAELLRRLEPETVDIALSHVDQPVLTPARNSVSEWSEAKSREVRALAARHGHPDIAIYPVAADPRGRVGPRPANRTSFDGTRVWDGVDAIRDSLDRPCPQQLRERAIVRVVQRALTEASSSLKFQLRGVRHDLAAAQEAAELLDRHLEKLDALEVEARANLKDELVQAARSGPPASARARVLVEADLWLDHWSERLGRLAREWGLEEFTWRGDLSLIGSIGGAGVPETPEDGDQLDVEAAQTFVRERLKSLDADQARVAELQAQLRQWDAAKRTHKTREFYRDAETRLSGIRDVREAQHELLKQRRRAVGVAVGQAVVDSIIEERKLRAEIDEKARAERVRQESAEALAVTTSRVLFDGGEDADSAFRSMFDALTDQLRDAQAQLREKADREKDELQLLEALMRGTASLLGGPSS